MIRVWFNHWFSTSYNLIELMKRDSEEEVYVIGSNRQINSVIQKVCDEWYEDSDSQGEEYIQYCLDFCREHRVDVFVPRHNMVDISKNQSRFTKIGVKIMVEDYEVMKILNDKASAYELLSQCEGLHIPDFYTVNDSASFVKAYNKLKKKYDNICVKFVQDEGAMSFRKIVDGIDRFKRLRRYSGCEIPFDEYADTLKLGEPFDDLMVMPYLPGHEISVDCLATDTGLIAVPREKGSARHERVIYDKEIMDMVHIIMDKVKLKYPCNIQFRIKDGVPYVLEINTRMSGGLQMSCLASGVNIPNIALNKVMGKSIPWSQNKDEKIVSYIEIPQVM